MHDGQMLFDSTKTWNGKEWQVDEHVGALLKNGSIKNCIIVGIFNNGAYRHTEYFPQKVLSDLPAATRDSLTHQFMARLSPGILWIKTKPDGLIKPVCSKG